MMRNKQLDNNAFYKLPKVLFTEKYKDLSTVAKVLYALLLDRNNLSILNNWIDSSGEVYQYFTIKEVKETLGFGNEKVCKLFKELEEVNLKSGKRMVHDIEIIGIIVVIIN